MQNKIVRTMRAAPLLFDLWKSAARKRIGEAARRVADRCEDTASPVSTGASVAKASTDFAAHPLHSSIRKHMELSKLFNFSNPFYRAHDRRKGAETFFDGNAYINFASYDYLGFAQHKRVLDAAKAAIDAYGTSVSASRIVAGERPIHAELEQALARFYGTENAVTFVSGHATNVSTIGTLLGRDDLIVYDELSHNSIIVGAKLSRATAIPFKHNDPESLEAILRERRGQHPRCIVAVEGLYSMDGDTARLPEIVDIKRRYNAWLMVDEAHALGVLGKTGRGSAEHFGLPNSDVDIWMGTLSKTLAGCGGYIAGSQALIDLMKYQAPGLVYSVGLSPPLAAAALTSLRLIDQEPERLQRLKQNGALFLSLAKSAGLDTVTSEGHAIVSVIVGDILTAGRLSDRLLSRGLNVLPIIFPAVPLKSTRFRFFITAEHTPEQIRTAVRVMAEELATVQRKKVA